MWQVLEKNKLKTQYCEGVTVPLPGTYYGSAFKQNKTKIATKGNSR